MTITARLPGEEIDLGPTIEFMRACQESGVPALMDLLTDEEQGGAWLERARAECAARLAKGGLGEHARWILGRIAEQGRKVVPRGETR